MIPATVRFTGLELDPRPLLRGRVNLGPIPPTWRRVRFEVDHEAALDKLNRWLAVTIAGRWAAYGVPLRFGAHVIVVAFESDVDAVMFRLHGGETAWNTQASHPD